MQSKTTFFLLKISAFLVFIGRAYQHIFWDEKLLKPFIHGISGSLRNGYFSSFAEDRTIQTLIQLNGFFYLITAIVVLLIQPNSKKWMKIILYLGGFSLALLSFLLFKEKSYQIPQFFEHSLQFGVVFMLLYYLINPDTIKLVYYLKVLIALTFISHGIYALGVFYPIPSNFVTMVVNIVPFQETYVINLLLIMGIIDLLIAILIFVPKLAKWILFYAFIWGTLTAFARIVSGLHDNFSLAIFHQYLFETIYRLAHGLVPLLVYRLIRN